QASDLALDLAHDPLGGLALPLQVAQLVVHVVHLTLQPLPLAFQPVSFGPDLLESAATFLQVRGALSLQRCRGQDEHEERTERTERAERAERANKAPLRLLRPLRPLRPLTHASSAALRSPDSRPG